MSRKKTGREGLLAWLQTRTAGYKGVKVVDFTDSWVDGLAFCALLHSFRPDLIKYEELSPSAKADNLQLAFTLAEKLGIPRLIEPADMLGEGGPDKFFVVTYLAQFVDHFRSQSTKQSEAGGPTLSSVKIYEEHSHCKQYEAEHKKRLRSHITKYLDKITMVKEGTVAGAIEVLNKHTNTPVRHTESLVDTTRGGTVNERVEDFKRKIGARSTIHRGDSFLLEKIPTGLVAERIATFLKLQEQIRLEIEFIMVTSPKSKSKSRDSGAASPSTRSMSNIYYVMRNNNNCASSSGSTNPISNLNLSSSGGILPPMQTVM